MTPEGLVKKEIENALHVLGCIKAGALKRQWPFPAAGWYYMPVQNGMGVTGIPDFVGSFNGKFFAIEAKRPKGGKTSPNQDARIEELQAAHAGVAVCRSGAEATAFLIGLGA